MLHIRDVEGPKKIRSIETRLEAMEKQVFKCQGMVERGLRANHMMITEFTSKHKMDAIDIGKHLSRLYDMVDQLRARSMTCKTLFVTIILDGHWIVCVVNLLDKQFSMFDSLDNDERDFIVDLNSFKPDWPQLEYLQQSTQCPGMATAVEKPWQLQLKKTCKRDQTGSEVRVRVDCHAGLRDRGLMYVDHLALSTVDLVAVGGLPPSHKFAISVWTNDLVNVVLAADRITDTTYGKLQASAPVEHLVGHFASGMTSLLGKLVEGWIALAGSDVNDVARHITSFVGARTYRPTGCLAWYDYNSS
ncbi:hypothetical protein D1007_02943 [Hordeum vulgare]|nr:hypothetical protein D1007_02943 [Hordeum vulgare]